jgi:hypothetical protein
MTKTTLSKRIDTSGIELPHKEKWSKVFKGEKEMTQATKDEIYNKVCDILREDGPDGHTDGAETITDYIMSILPQRQEAQPPMNEVAKRCEIAAIKRGLGDDKGQLRDLLEEAGYEIERLARENGRLKK